MKRLVVAWLLATGSLLALAQTGREVTGAVAYEAVEREDWDTAYDLCMTMLENNRLQAYTTFLKDARKQLTGLMEEKQERRSVEYKRCFNALMQVYDLELRILPQLSEIHSEELPTEADVWGLKAVDYVRYAPKMKPELAYVWLRKAVGGVSGQALPLVLQYFVETSLDKAVADERWVVPFLYDYEKAVCCADTFLLAGKDDGARQQMQTVRSRLDTMLIGSKLVNSDVLRQVYGLQVKKSGKDSLMLQRVMNICERLQCDDSEFYAEVVDSLYQLRQNPDLALALACAYCRCGEYERAVEYFDRALESADGVDWKFEIAYAAAVALLDAERFQQARNYCQQALLFKENDGKGYMLLAQIYASNTKWSKNSELNKCTYFLVIDNLVKAKTVNPDIVEEVDEAISIYAAYTPKVKDLYMLGYKTGDRITIGGWIGETTTIR